MVYLLVLLLALAQSNYEMVLPTCHFNCCRRLRGIGLHWLHEAQVFALKHTEMWSNFEGVCLGQALAFTSND